MGKYYSLSETEQYDFSGVVGGDSELFTAAEGITALPTSVVLAESPNASIGDVIFNEFPDAVRSSLSELIGVVETSVVEGSRLARESAAQQIESQKVIAASTQQSNQALADKLTATEQGTASVLPQVAKYAAIAVAVVLVGRRFL